LKGIYALTPDGLLHEQVMTTGADFAPPVKFLPPASDAASALNFADHMIYAVAGASCANAATRVSAIDLASGDYSVDSLSAGKVRALASTGVPLTPDGAAIVVTDSGASDSTADVPPASVVSISKEMKVQDWYTPTGGMASYKNVSPAVFEYKGKQFIVAPGKQGGVALLDAASLGGVDHHTPLFESAPFTKAGEKHSWDGFAVSQDKAGATWIFASISAGLAMPDGVQGNGTASHGGIVAFKINDANGELALTPAWVSQDMVNPAPPSIANGLVVALAGGDASTHAVLHVFNAATGAEIYSSKDLIPTYSQLSGVSIGDSHAFFTDHDNVLYSFGIGLEH
jgi:hypothetical protein